VPKPIKKNKAMLLHVFSRAGSKKRIGGVNQILLDQVSSIRETDGTREVGVEGQTRNFSTAKERKPG